MSDSADAKEVLFASLISRAEELGSGFDQTYPPGSSHRPSFPSEWL